jgi:putative transposase
MDELFDAKKVEEKFRNAKTLADITGKDGLVQEIIKNTVEKMLKAELDAHLGYPPHDPSGKNSGNSRNGYGSKTLKTGQGPVEIQVPRDRNGTFEPQLIEKRKSFDPQLEGKILSMYAKGMSTRDITSHLEEVYGTQISPALISAVTNRIMEEVTEWQQRPLDKVYPFVFLDAFFIKVREDSKVISKACYSALAVNVEGKNEMLGIWIAEGEGAHFWLKVLTDLKARGVEDILVASVDGLTGFEDAIRTIFPKTDVQRCIVHQIRNSLKYVSVRDHKEVVQDLRPIYTAPTEETAFANLAKFEEKWSVKYRVVVELWRKNWDSLTTFFNYPAPVRRIIYTTNIVEGFHRRVRKVIKNKCLFPNDDSVRKMIYLVIKDIDSKQRSAKREWGSTLAQLALIFENRLSLGSLR